MQLRCLVLVALVAPAYALISSCPALGSHTSGWRAPAVRLEFVEEKADQPQTTTAASTISAEQAREEAALKFGAALSRTWATGSAAFDAVLALGCRVDTPVWKCKDRAEFEAQLKGAHSFLSALSAPTLTVLSSRALKDGRVQLSWMLGVEWPAVWRPRVNLLGESTLTFARPAAEGAVPLVSSIVERWHQSPSDAFFSQMLPKLRDVASLQATPTAEHVPLPVLERCDGYEVRRVPPLRVLQAEVVETGDLLLVEQAPLPPAFAFGGEVKRKDWYSCVSPGLLERSFCTVSLPGGMQKTGQRRRWISALPARYSSDPSTLPSLNLGSDDGEDDGYLASGMVSSPSLQYLRRPAQLLAVRRLNKIPSNELVLSTAVELMKLAERDGRRVVKRNGRPVVMQISGDVKYGFNDRKELAMTVWLSVPDQLRDEYVGVVIDDGAGDRLPGDDD